MSRGLHGVLPLASVVRPSTYSSTISNQRYVIIRGDIAVLGQELRQLCIGWGGLQGLGI
jgi:hypothetical protein